MTLTLTPDKIAAARAELATQGINLDGNDGEVEHSGVTLAYHYDPEAQLLTIHTVKKPFFIPEGQIESQIKDWFQA